MTRNVRGRAGCAVATQILRTRAYTAYFADADCDKRRIPQMSDPDRDIDAFIDDAHDAIDE
jgi:hypothetical protein